MRPSRHMPGTAAAMDTRTPERRPLSHAHTNPMMGLFCCRVALVVMVPATVTLGGGEASASSATRLCSVTAVGDARWLQRRGRSSVNVTHTGEAPLAASVKLMAHVAVMGAATTTEHSAPATRYRRGNMQSHRPSPKSQLAAHTTLHPPVRRQGWSGEVCTSCNPLYACNGRGYCTSGSDDDYAGDDDAAIATPQQQRSVEPPCHCMKSWTGPECRACTLAPQAQFANVTLSLSECLHREQCLNSEPSKCTVLTDTCSDASALKYSSRGRLVSCVDDGQTQAH